MAYDEQLAQRVRDALRRRRGISERKMFGGLAFLLNGNMCCGITGDDLMVRVGPDDYEDALAQPHARPMDFTGRPMTGLVYVAGSALTGDGALLPWIERGLEFARTLPPK